MQNKVVITALSEHKQAWCEVKDDDFVCTYRPVCILESAGLGWWLSRATDVQDTHSGPASQCWASRVTSRKPHPWGANWVRVRVVSTYSFQQVLPVRKVMNECEGSETLSRKRKKKKRGLLLYSNLFYYQKLVKTEVNSYSEDKAQKGKSRQMFCLSVRLYLTLWSSRDLVKPLTIPDRWASQEVVST